jgi:cytochrome o ubiquinol oxidase operon protein cyoD
MKEDVHVLEALQKSSHSTFGAYVVGFILSILLTMIAYLMVVNHLLPQAVLFPTLMSLGMVQAVIQLLFFLHVGKESKPHWNLIMLLSMVVVLVVIIIGSLWIMQNLNYRVMPDMNSAM